MSDVEKRMVVLGHELPAAVEKQTLDFMKSGVDSLRGFFAAWMIAEGVVETMKESGFDIRLLPSNWGARVADSLIQRERKAGNIEKHGFGKSALWKWRPAEATTGN
ncbi:hypothetical protein [Ottowia sp.]|uniref:hypothetical protein n=1 Tax=Ottowia sp. TaxID=1898956 RepID=UPI0025CF4829|nr:hypothetical protein [Ottowia sp.]MBK6616354.1 hypothetical protein [Ottowia sp.]